MPTKREMRDSVAELPATLFFFWVATWLHLEFPILGVWPWVIAVGAQAAVFGSSSGGEVNPGVSAGFLAGGRKSVTLFFVYVALQTAGAFLGILAGIYSFAGSLELNMAEKLVVGGGQGVSDLEIGLIELTTGFLAFVVLAATEKRVPKWVAPFAIAGTLALLLNALGDQSGGSFNPLRAFAPAILAGRPPSEILYTLLVYVVPGLAGGLIGGGFYLLMKEDT